MPHPTLTTTWPGADDLRKWLGDQAVGAVTDATLIPELVADASSWVYGQIDPNKLPEDTDECPRDVARAIVLHAARLLYRRQSPHGLAAFNDIAVRLRTVDADIEALLARWRLDPEP